MLWAAVADRLKRPLISQVAHHRRRGSVTGKRQTEHGYDTITSPLPAIVAVSDAINEPRYPSLKGIMGAGKPQETVSLSDLGVDRSGWRGCGEDHRTRRLGAPPRATR